MVATTAAAEVVVSRKWLSRAVKVVRKVDRDSYNNDSKNNYRTISSYFSQSSRFDLFGRRKVFLHNTALDEFQVEIEVIVIVKYTKKTMNHL